MDRRRVRHHFCPFCRKAVWPGDRCYRVRYEDGRIRVAHEGCD